MKRADYRYDVVVCGGGIAGVAAALAAARAGARTALLEKTFFTGGLATAGLVNIYLPLCDGYGRQVTFGLAEELLRLSLRYGPGDVSPGWRHGGGLCEPQRFRAPFSPAAFILALDEALENAGVALWLDTRACAPLWHDGQLAGVEAETADGSLRFRAGCVVDATGDAVVARRAGARCVAGPNRLSIWALQVTRRGVRQAARGRDPSAVLWDAIMLDGPPGRPFRGTGARQITDFALASRRLLRRHYARAQAGAGPSGRKQAYPVCLPALPQFRTTFRIVGRTTVRTGEQGRARTDSVGLVADWRRPGSVWEVPFGALVPKTTKGLLVAGRCMAAAGDAWQVMRVIPAAALTGQMAGLAAALAVQRGMAPDRLPAEDIQRILRRRRIPLHLSDVMQ